MDRLLYSGFNKGGREHDQNRGVLNVSGFVLAGALLLTAGPSLAIEQNEPGNRQMHEQMKSEMRQLEDKLEQERRAHQDKCRQEMRAMEDRQHSEKEALRQKYMGSKK
jgi:hypothetical protein